MPCEAMAEDERKTSTSTSADFIVGYGLSDGKVAAVGGPPFLARPPLHLYACRERR
jgi:hypothetical protein